MTKLKAQHTPGPWKVMPKKYDDAVSVAIGADSIGRIIFRCSDGNIEANAALIAASPELLAACKNGMAMLLRNTLQDAKDTAAYHQMKIAIAKATGEK